MQATTKAFAITYPKFTVNASKKRWILLKHAILGYLPAEQQQWMIMLGHSQ